VQVTTFHVTYVLSYTALVGPMTYYLAQLLANDFLAASGDNLMPAFTIFIVNTVYYVAEATLRALVKR